MNQTDNLIKYPVGVQSFPEIREGNYVYVDKTSFVHRLASTGKYFFLSRPRRFGKSLLISTIEAYYQGRRELFKGLALDHLTEEWDPHPVFRLDLNNREYKDETSLIRQFNVFLRLWEKEYGTVDTKAAPEERFGNVIRAAYEKTGKKVVILVDEYDKPMLDTRGNEELAEIYRSQLKAFYSNLKSLDDFIKIGILTGVARFSKISIFSDLNNLRDISFNPEYAAICGVTQEELEKNFKNGITSLSEVLGKSEEDTLLELKRNYDGYHFAKSSPDIYNPFSLINVFADNDLRHYWFESGTPEFLVNLIQRSQWNLENLTPATISESKLASSGILSENPIPVLYQTGYLTIKDYDYDFRECTLDYPNEEVKEGFFSFLVPYYLYPDEYGDFSVRNFVTEVRNGEAEEFMKRLESLIAKVPYSDKGAKESHFQNAIYLLFNLMGFHTSMELRTCNGRIDLKVETSRYIYIFEFKIDSSAKSAINQIEKRRYWLGDTMSKKQIFLIGANFSTKDRQLSDYEIVRL